eukprot:sb/3465046/
MGTGPGSLKLISQHFTSTTEGCLVLDLASTVYPSDYREANFTVSLRDLYSKTTVYSLEECTSTDCYELTRRLVKIDIPVGDSMQVLLEWKFGLNEQYSGTIALFESAYVADTTCDTFDDNYYDACDMYWPCDLGTCTPKGVRGFECQCDPGYHGERCSNTTVTCGDHVIIGNITGVEGVEVVPGYWTEEVLVTCEEAYTLNNQSLIRCPVDLQENTTNTCVPIQCPPFPVSNSNTTQLNLTHLVSTCLPGFLPTQPQTYSCHLGSWLPAPTTCTPDCSFINTTIEVGGRKTMSNMGVRVCHHHCSFSSSYTNCSEVSRSVRVGESVRMSSSDLGGVVVRPQLQNLCIRYHDNNSTTDSCVERCTDDIYLRIETADGLMIEVLRDVSDADSFIVSHAAPSSNISSNILLISCLIALFVKR